MKIFVTVVGIAFFGCLNTAQAASTPAPRNLVCTNNSGSVSISLCGVRGCVASVTNGGTTVRYLENRKKGTDGSLTYTTRPGSRSRCTIVVGPLHSGLRLLETVSCAESLEGATCQIR